jgi:methylated-DNA-[protein]-cysteine S-methyltransferase
MIVAASSQGVVRVGLPGEKEADVLQGLRKCTWAELEKSETALLKRAEKELTEYFEGKRREFSVPVHVWGTPFQKKVWRTLESVPYGQTRSYQEVARKAGNAKAARAVGMANNRNPVPILIPCHRVIGKDGSMVGYGGGLPMKKRLLKLESGDTIRISDS